MALVNIKNYEQIPAGLLGGAIIYFLNIIVMIIVSTIPPSLIDYIFGMYLFFSTLFFLPLTIIFVIIYYQLGWEKEKALKNGKVAAQ
jgi:hypothetical protein